MGAVDDKSIPLDAKAKRTRFFGDSGVDSVLTMATELMAEVWVLKERLFVLEKVLADSGIQAREKIESVVLSQDDIDSLETTRRQYVETIMRAFNMPSVDKDKAHKDIDELTESMKQTDKKR